VEVIICDKGNLGIQAKNTYESLVQNVGCDFWFVLLPTTQEEELEAREWADSEKHVIVCDHEYNVGGYLNRNRVYELFPKAEWFTRIAPGVIITEDYFNYLRKHKKDPVVGAVGAVGYFIHGNWEGVLGNEVPPKHMAHTLDDYLWSWKACLFRYEPPFNTMCYGHIDHQLFIHFLGKNCLTAPSSSIQFKPEGFSYDETEKDAIDFLANKWKGKLDFLKVSEITGV
jgi:hypothetical protein